MCQRQVRTIMSEIIFEVTEDGIDSGYSASALGYMAFIPKVIRSKSFAGMSKKPLSATLTQQ